MKCYNKKFDNRYCEATNIYYKSRHFVFTTTAYYEFPSDFVLLSPRNTTDHQSDRLSYMPIVTNRHLEYDERIDSITYVLSFYSDFYDMMKSHYEFLFPVYATINNIEKSVSNGFDRQFLLFHENPYLNQLFGVFSDKTPIIADSIRDIMFLKRVVFGMERFWTQVQTEPYNYHVSFEKLNGLKELAIARLGINITKSTNLTLFTLSEHHFDNFQNYRQFYDQIKQDCPSSNIIWADLIKMDIKTAIQYATQASAIVGQNSNALIVGFWLKPNSFLVEMIPNKFDCDKWYEDVAKYSNVRYIRTADNSDNSFYAKTAEQKELLPKCYSREDRCRDPDCYYRLKHQIFLYYADEWNDLWNFVCNNMF
ncbi:hypothetical protein TVAG_035530 [Trichomonas vaginalis G3]|uniref:Uncharacterized protein n=1 Tax=Trichomonas vaginalis (strain ATCC PRA-98 / G3) TaxID=412133 RepID=A2DAM7_TRIV3|nr:glycosyltransferase family [Trichomonas vaginalis G3]EAY22530.1 hypothetical protein TVAG_035530 [Trichomonas vaginalis G3]KAI5497263.1 glycosyltransferase family [Trichomonas vaginalis G3]|eukprot:XP_001583516.1 hypothetical protein [Trichomonas vaginalis G3]